jgi:drug/metabolite transporter (DMT)-like permease
MHSPFEIHWVRTVVGRLDKATISGRAKVTTLLQGSPTTVPRPGPANVTDPSSPPQGGRLYRLGPSIMGASAFACADVLAKFALLAGAGVLTMVTARSVIGLAMLYAWLRFDGWPQNVTPRAKWISLGLGALFTGNVFFLFKAFQSIEVPVAVLTYYTYPLLTGLAAAATGLERLGMKGVAAALAAFFGLALMIGAHPAGFAGWGVLAALAASGFRVATLLIIRAALPGVDGRLITWYSLLASTVLFAALLLASWSWQPPASMAGWYAIVALGFTTTAGMLGVFLGAVRIGPFRSALFMNLEPLLATIGSAIFLGEVITPLQALGGSVMIAALMVFQMRR